MSILFNQISRVRPLFYIEEIVDKEVVVFRCVKTGDNTGKKYVSDTKSVECEFAADQPVFLPGDRVVIDALNKQERKKVEASGQRQTTPQTAVKCLVFRSFGKSPDPLAREIRKAKEFLLAQ